MVSLAALLQLSFILYGQKMTKIFYRFEKGKSGWRYKYKNYISKPYKTREEAENALNVRVAKLQG